MKASMDNVAPERVRAEPEAQPRASTNLLQSRHGLTLLNEIISYILLVAGAVIILIPFFWMLSTALKPGYQVFVFPPQWIPNPILWSNFTDAMTALPFALFFRNTMIIEVGVIIGTVLSCSIVAYGFARLRAPGKTFWFIILLSTMMLPGVVTMIPTYILYAKLGWVNTFLPLIVPAYFGSAFFIFLLRQFFMTIPNDYEEAARIDGANTWQILANVILPLSKPALATVAIFTFMGVWNDFMGPLIYLNRQDLYTLALGLNFFRGQYNVQWNLLMAASLVLMLPMLILFFSAQRIFIEGITLTGIK